MATINGTTGPDSLTGTTSADTVNAFGGADTVRGDLGNDLIYGADGNDSLFGDAGADTLVGGAGTDSLYGGTENDTLDGGLDNDSLYGGSGTDTADFSSIAAAVTVNLGSNSATGQGTDLLNSIENVIGSTLNDSITGSTSANVLDGGTGADSLYGGGNTDTLFGGDNDDYLDGGTSSDSLSGGLGNDTLLGGASGDVIDGGGGTDAADYTGSAAVSVNLQTGSALYGDAAGDTLSGIENLIGGANNDTLTGQDSIGNVLYGAAGADSLSGGAGADTLYGGAGIDSLYGGNDNDLLVGGSEGDALFGGSGTDTADYTASAAGVNINLTNNTATGGDAAGDTFNSVENLTGSASADTLVGTNEANVLQGAGGADSLDGRSGDDAVAGGTGNDTVAGGKGADTLSGDDGTDRIYGGDGGDSITGGIGADTIYGDSDAPGVWTYDFYNKDFTAANGQAFTIESGTLVASGTTDDFNLLSIAAQAGRTEANPEDFGVILRSTYVASESGTYTFSTTSDDGSTLQVFDANGNPLTITTGGVAGTYLNNDYHQAATTRSGTVTLSAGQSYTIEVRIWENLGEQVLGGTITLPSGATSALVGNTGLASSPFNTGADTISGGDGNDSILGENGDDSITGDAGADTIYGGTGADTVDGGADNDSIYGDAGTDVLSGGDGLDRLDGGADNDSLFGGADVDSLYGGSGNDTLAGGAAGDVISGGSGMDYGDYSASGAGVNVNLTTGAGLGGDAQGDTISGIDGLYGSAHDDTLTGYDMESTVPGDLYTNVFYGAAGNDLLYGMAGSDQLFGGADNDTVYGGADADQILGGSGNDSLLGEGGADQILGEAGDDRIIGGALGDALFGGDDRDTFIVTIGSDGVGDAIDGSEGGLDADILDLTGAGPLKVIKDTGNPENGIVQFYDNDRNIIGTLSFSNIETVVPCFTPGTMIETAQGSVAVEALQPGDLVWTRDHGLQPLRWIGGRTLDRAQLQAQPTLAPVRIAAGALGRGQPLRDMLVSPQHRVLIAGNRAELLFGEPELLVAAAHLVGQPGITQVEGQPVRYIHLMFDRHEIVLSDGLWTESFQPGDRTLAGMDAGQRAELDALFPGITAGRLFPAARRALKSHEARVLFAA